MGLDYKEIGAFIKANVEDAYDHKLLLRKTDCCVNHAQVPENSVVWFEENPTSETLAEAIYYKAVLYFATNSAIKVEYVRVEETCSSSCTYRGE